MRSNERKITQSIREHGVGESQARAWGGLVAKGEMQMERRVHFLLVGCLLALLAGLARQSAVGVAEAQGEADLALFLPVFAVSEEAVIKGIVHDGGYPAANVLLELRFFDGAGWSTLADAVSTVQGSFRFADVPALGPGQVYYVLYRNADDPGRLTAWATEEFAVFGPKDVVNVGTFDIANVTLLTPDPGATVTLPTTFGWEMRSLPSDSYEFNLFGLGDPTPYFYTDPPLGYVASYVLSGLPPGFALDTEYAWDIWIYGPNGGRGISSGATTSYSVVACRVRP